MGSTADTFITAETRKGLAMFAGFLGAACVIGAMIAALGQNSDTLKVAVGLSAVGMIAAAVSFAIELPVMTVVRITFIFSFFFKGDVNYFRIDEMEDPSGLNLSVTLLIGAILLVSDLVFEQKRDRVIPLHFAVLSGSLFAAALISVIYAGSSMLGWFSLFSFAASIFITFVVAFHFSYRERLGDLVIGVAAGLAFTGFVSATQYYFEFPTSLPSLGTGTEEELLGTQSQLLSRVPAFMRTPTEMAWVVSSLIPVVIAPVICRVKGLAGWRRLLLMFGGGLGTVAVILSLARGSWLSLLAAMAIVAIGGFYAAAEKQRPTYLVSSAVSIVLIALLLSPFAARIYDRLTEDDGGSSEIRLPLMETAARLIADNPIVGVGLNGYRENMTKYDETGIFVSQVFPNPVHNTFAHISAEIGIPGAILFSLLIIAALFECVRGFNTGDRLLSALALGIGAGLIAFVISAMKEPGSLGSVRPPMRTLFFMFGAIYAISRIRRRLML